MKISHRNVTYAATALAFGQFSQAEQNHAKRDATTPNCPLNVTNVTGADPGLASMWLIDHATKILDLGDAATPDASSPNSTNSTGAAAEQGNLTPIPSASFWTQNIASGNDTVWAVVYNSSFSNYTDLQVGLAPTTDLPGVNGGAGNKSVADSVLDGQLINDFFQSNRTKFEPLLKALVGSSGNGTETQTGDSAGSSNCYLEQILKLLNDPGNVMEVQPGLRSYKSYVFSQAIEKSHNETNKNRNATGENQSSVPVNPDDGASIVGLNLYLTQVEYNFEYTVDAVAYIIESIPNVGPQHAEHFSYYMHRMWDHVTDKLSDQSDNLVSVKPVASNGTDATVKPMNSTGPWYTPDDFYDWFIAVGGSNGTTGTNTTDGTDMSIGNDSMNATNTTDSTDMDTGNDSMNATSANTDDNDNTGNDTTDGTSVDTTNGTSTTGTNVAMSTPTPINGGADSNGTKPLTQGSTNSTSNNNSNGGNDGKTTTQDTGDDSGGDDDGDDGDS